jgi:hypothetical protein
VEVVKKLRGGAAQALGQLSIAARILVVLVACVLVGGLLFWLFNEAFYFYLARSYAEELADAYDLNWGLTSAVLWASFAAIVTFSGCMFSFSKFKRRIGYLGLGALLIGHSLLLGRVDTNFRKNGVAERCYVMTRTAIKVLNRTGIDPETGLECHPLSPQMAEKIELYRSGHRPTQITSSDPKFFDAITGEPIVWYSKNDKGEIELFDLMGFHPKTGEELKPITRQVADAWKAQNEKTVHRAAALVADPDKFGFFDPVTGAAKVWYWRGDNGSYEFYDGPGFQSRTGDPLKIITRDAIADWRKQLEIAAAKEKAEEVRKEREAAAQAQREVDAAKAQAAQAAEDAQASAAQAAVQAIAAPAGQGTTDTNQSMSAVAGQMVSLLFELSSGPADKYLGSMNAVYSDHVDYFGDSLSRDEVAAKIGGFVARWPQRSYVMQPGSLVINCNADQMACTAGGVVAFDAVSPDRRRHSHGQATFSYMFAFGRDRRYPWIIKEGGTVLQRQIDRF